MSNIKRKLNAFSKRNINADIVKLIILCVLVLVIGWRHFFTREAVISDIVDVSIIISFLFVSFCEVIVRLIIYVVGRLTEDDTKLHSDYENLVKKYSADKRQMVCAGDIVIPEIELCSRKLDSDSFEFEIEVASARKYELPKQIADHSVTLFEAHKYSKVYNNTNIRLNDFEYSKEVNRVKMTYSFTTYFDSLLTNRAMDYPFAENNRTVREIYEPGPFVSELKESKLSNHLGFNGFVELSDKRIIFVHRGSEVSIGKGTWQVSIGASLKTLYALNEEKKLTQAGLSAAICGEIRDELKIDVPDEYEYSKHIFAFYRDLIEGGKPQFLFYYKVENLSSGEFEKHFKEIMRKAAEKKANKQKQIVDGIHFKYITRDELKKAELGIDYIRLENGDKLHMLPSMVGSIALFLKAM